VVGSEALELTYKDPTGKLANGLLYRHDEPRLEVGPKAGRGASTATVSVPPGVVCHERTV